MKKIVFVVFIFAVPALAEEKATDVKQQDAFLSSLSTSHDFGATEINGEKKEPFVDLLQGTQKQKLNELIQIEPDLNQAILQSKTAVRLLN